jgi:hypothetical protein
MSDEIPAPLAPDQTSAPLGEKSFLDIVVGVALDTQVDQVNDFQDMLDDILE